MSVLNTADAQDVQELSVEDALQEVANLKEAESKGEVIEIDLREDKSKDDDVHIAEQISERLPYSFLTAILVKPLETVMVERPKPPELVDPHMHDKYLSGGVVNNGKPKKKRPEMESVPAGQQAAIILKLPTKLPEHLEGSLKVGDIVIIPMNHIQPFDLYAKSALISPASILGLYEGSALEYNMTVAYNGKVKPKSKQK